MLDATTSNTDAFLLRGTCFPTIHLNRPIWNKMSISHLSKH
jgi:hypothetical protein